MYKNVLFLKLCSIICSIIETTIIIYNGEGENGTFPKYNHQKHRTLMTCLVFSSKHIGILFVILGSKFRWVILLIVE